jgi:hypothetical protein
MYTVAALGGHSDPLQVWEPTPPGFIMGMVKLLIFCKLSYRFIQKRVLYMFWLY